MRIQLASDLHLEHTARRFPGWRAIEPAPGAEVLVLAGDIHTGVEGLGLFCDWPVPVVYVPGNHEFYGRHLQATSVALRQDAQRLGIHLLDNDVLECGGVRFVGGTLWTDFEAEGLALTALALARQQIADFSTITFGSTGWFLPTQSVLLHRMTRQLIEDTLATPWLGKTVVVTHHAPSKRSVHPRFHGSHLNAAFVSQLDALVAKADLWLHGHTHDSFDYHIGECRVVANPGGYPSGHREAATPADLQRENPLFNPQLVIDI